LLRLATGKLVHNIIYFGLSKLNEITVLRLESREA